MIFIIILKMSFAFFTVLTFEKEIVVKTSGVTINQGSDTKFH